MRGKTALAMALILFVLSSCTKRQTVKAEAQPMETPPPQEELKVVETQPPPPEELAAQEKRPPRKEPVLIEKEKEEKYILINFENTDIQTVISSFGELLNINYILTPGISGSITLQSYRKFPAGDLFQIFQSVLEMNGLTAVKEGPVYKIVPLDSAKLQSVDVEKGRKIYTLDASFVTQLIPLEFVKATDIASILRNLMPRGTDIIIYEPANMLIVTALPMTLQKFMKIIEALDIPATETETVKTFVYYVENGEATKLEKILEAMYTGKSGVTAAARTAPARTAPARRPPARTPVIAGETTLPGEMGEITVSAYEDINALIIKATPRNYLSLLEVLKKIDVPPKQVLIEVMILEITLSDTFQFGLEWLLRTGSGDIVGLNLGGVTIPPEFPNFPADSFAAVIQGKHGDDVINSVLSSLARESKLNVLASPHILARDNKEARIEIGDEIPVATGLTQQPATGGGGTTLVTTGQIQFKTVGTILKVTPRITDKNMVTMEISQEQSQLGEVTLIAGQGFQGFSTRKATTTATVQSGHTLILGGLISEQKNRSRSGIPLLSKIPLLGYLFSSTVDSYDRTELIVLVTPHVVRNQEQADALTRQYQNRVKTIKSEIERLKSNEKGQEEGESVENEPSVSGQSTPSTDGL
jgi:general secretion pathway protein D